jgi:hypothetical protein
MPHGLTTLITRFLQRFVYHKWIAEFDADEVKKKDMWSSEN